MEKNSEHQALLDGSKIVARADNRCFGDDTFVKAVIAIAIVGTIFGFVTYMSKPIFITNIIDPIKQIDSSEVLAELLDDVDTVFFDLDGTIFIDDQPIEGAIEFVKKCQSLGKEVFIASNTGGHTRDELAKFLRKFGLNLPFDNIYTGAYVAAMYLKSINISGQVYVLGSYQLKQELDSANVSNIGTGKDSGRGQHTLTPSRDEFSNDVKSVLISQDDYVNHRKLIKLVTYAAKVDPNLLFTLSGSGLNVGTIDGWLLPLTGPYSKFVQETTGRKPNLIGKPSKIYSDAILGHEKVKVERSLMVGDTPVTDIGFARSSGIKYSILVGTGKAVTYDEIIEYKENRPTHYAQSLESLLELAP
ncbi:4-nitrophenylphosphatase [Halotydeus destructor]|nr:4-nitrophenylphosphatase [Halotydeus destructor]